MHADIQAGGAPSTSALSPSNALGQKRSDGGAALEIADLHAPVCTKALLGQNRGLSLPIAAPRRRSFIISTRCHLRLPCDPAAFNSGQASPAIVTDKVPMPEISASIRSPIFRKVCFGTPTPASRRPVMTDVARIERHDFSDARCDLLGDRGRSSEPVSLSCHTTFRRSRTTSIWPSADRQHHDAGTIHGPSHGPQVSQALPATTVELVEIVPARG